MLLVVHTVNCEPSYQIDMEKFAKNQVISRKNATSERLRRLLFLRSIVFHTAYFKTSVLNPSASFHGNEILNIVANKMGEKCTLYKGYVVMDYATVTPHYFCVVNDEDSCFVVDPSIQLFLRNQSQPTIKFSYVGKPYITKKDKMIQCIYNDFVNYFEIL